jgi:hypothetical protein
VKARGRDVFDDDPALIQRSALLRVTYDAHALTVAAIGIGEIKIAVARKLWMQRQIHQAALARGFDIRQRRHGRRPQLAVLDDAHPARTFGQEETAIRREGERPGDF